MFTVEELFHFLIHPILIGFLGGISALLFRFLILSFENQLNFFHLNDFSIFLYPTIFIASNFIVHKVLFEPPAITLDNIAKKIIFWRGGFSPLRSFFVLILTSLNIAIGLPVGREAPIAKFGALLGEIYIKISKIRNSIDIPLYLTASVASAIAATFNAPLAGIILGIEIIIGRLNLYILIPLIVSTTTATLISREFWGDFAPLRLPHLQFEDIYFFLVPIISIFFALITLLIFYSFDFFKLLRLKAKRKWYYILGVNGFITAVILNLFKEAQGVGYKYIFQLYNFKYHFFKVLGIFIAKLITLILTIGSGLFGGLMSPSIFLGSFGGFILGSLFKLGFNHIDPRVAALIGSTAMLSGLSRAPLRSTILIIELSHSYQLLLPSLIAASFTSWLVAKFEPGSYFRRSLIQQGLNIDDPKVIQLLKNLNLEKYVEKIPPLYSQTSISKAIKVFSKLHLRLLPVVNKDKELIGVLSVRDFMKILGNIYNPSSKKVSDILNKTPVVLKNNADLNEILKILSLAGTEYIPYVDENNRYLGMLNLQKLFKDISVNYYTSKI